MFVFLIQDFQKTFKRTALIKNITYYIIKQNK